MPDIYRNCSLNASIVAMVCAIILALLPALVTSSGDGNIKLLEEEVAAALQGCTFPNNSHQRARRSDNESKVSISPRIDNSKQSQNQYGHERRNTSDIDQIQVLNVTDYDYGGNAVGNETMRNDDDFNRTSTNERTKRSDSLFNKPESDQCLSQCVFANLQVVDSRGIPRETELWNRVQTSVTSQQSRSALRDQIRACFQELQSEAEDNGCSYSNKLERCLMLRFADRKVNTQKNRQNK